MFTGIVKQVCRIAQVQKQANFLSFELEMGALASGLQIGASVAVDGVCLTVTKIEGSNAWFDAIEETLKRTSLKSLQQGDRVNVERAACFGDEIGGHLLSGHIYGTARIEKIIRSSIIPFQEQLKGHWELHLSCPSAWMRYLLPKGYVALNGASLTLVERGIKGDLGWFSVHLIPETLKKTTFAEKQVGDLVNVELDASTQAIVDTVERIIGDTKGQQGPQSAY